MTPSWNGPFNYIQFEYKLFLYDLYESKLNQKLLTVIHIIVILIIILEIYQRNSILGQRDEHVVVMNTLIRDQKSTQSIC